MSTAEEEFSEGAVRFLEGYEWSPDHSDDHVEKCLRALADHIKSRNLNKKYTGDLI